MSMKPSIVKLAYTIVLCIFVIGVVASVTSPAGNYELSIYDSTPIMYWISIVCCIFITPIAVSRTKIRLYPVVIMSFMVSTIAFLPIIRGYYFVSEHDAMTHLGYLLDLERGYSELLDIFYPASHSLTYILSNVSGVTFERGVLLVSSIFAICFIIFVPICVRQIYFGRTIETISIFSALMLLPLGQNSIHFSPNEFGRLFFPIIMTLVIMYYFSGDNRIFILILINSIFYLFLHPQTMASATIYLYGIFIGSVILSSNSSKIEIINNRFFPIVAIFTIIIFIWVQSRETFTYAIQSFSLSFAEQEGPQRTSSVALSLEQVGGSIIEVFFKLYTPQLIFVILVGFLTIWLFWSGLTSSLKTQNHSVLFILSLGIVPLFILFIINLVGDAHYTRYFDFTMAIVTVLGSAAIYIFYKYLDIDIPEYVFLALAVILLISIAGMFQSPYVYQDNRHVPESQFQGFETSFEYEGEDIVFNRVRSPVFRYVHATYGQSEDYRKYTGGAYRAGTPDHFADQELTTYYQDSTYVAVTGADRLRDPVLWDGIRYTEDDFSYLERDGNINKLYSNNQFDLYLVSPNPRESNKQTYMPHI